MRRLLTEPLVHFLFLGGILFAVFEYTGSKAADTSSGDHEIVVTAGRIQTLVENFAKVWQRPPSPSEMSGLIEDFIKEEVYYREALAMGLDHDDTIIRRRLRQKMEFISSDLSEPPTPTDEELAATLEANPAAYRIDPVLTFEQVYLDPGQHAEALDADLEMLHAELVSADSPAAIAHLGDRLMMESSFEAMAVREINRLFGQGFGEALAEAKLHVWTGPVRSGYGLHFVRITDRVEGRTPSVDEVRTALERDWRGLRRQETEDAFYRALRKQYTLTVEE